MAERGVNHFIDEKEVVYLTHGHTIYIQLQTLFVIYVYKVRSDMGSIGDLKKNPARELVKTAGLTVVDGAMGAIGGKINIGAEKISNKVIVDFCFYVFLQKKIFTR